MNINICWESTVIYYIQDVSYRLVNVGQSDVHCTVFTVYGDRRRLIVAIVDMNKSTPAPTIALPFDKAGKVFTKESLNPLGA